MRKILGIIGYPLGHSFSPAYFQKKLIDKQILDVEYKTFPIENLDSFRTFFQENPEVVGLNVTIPHKQKVIPFIDEIDPQAEQINAVNVLTIRRKEGVAYIKGYNTDCIGFENSLKPLLKSNEHQALVLGNGGASKAVQFVLTSLGIPFIIVSRIKKSNKEISYQELTEDYVAMHNLIINTTPLGMYPEIDGSPNIPYQAITEHHILYDLVYNPEETLFLRKGKEKGAIIKNGLEMLHLQAEKAFELWQNEVL